MFRDSVDGVVLLQFDSIENRCDATRVASFEARILGYQDFGTQVTKGAKNSTKKISLRKGRHPLLGRGTRASC